MDKTFFENKTIGEVINESTKIPQTFMEGYDIKTEKIRDIFLLRDENNNTVFADWLSGIVIVYKNDNPKILFSVYDIEDVNFNKERGLILASGHETIHEYWLDNGEYNERYTR